MLAWRRWASLKGYFLCETRGHPAHKPAAQCHHQDELLKAPFIDIYTAVPPDLEWNGLPIHGSAGLELGLIKKFALPWNVRSAG
jgi:hypothetical protein